MDAHEPSTGWFWSYKVDRSIGLVISTACYTRAVEGHGFDVACVREAWNESFAIQRQMQTSSINEATAAKLSAMARNG